MRALLRAPSRALRRTGAGGPGLVPGRPSKPDRRRTLTAKGALLDMPELLTDSEIQRKLASLPGWRREGNEIVRTFEFPTFPEAIAFVDRVAQAAEEANHHPDIDIRYTRVTLRLTSHDSGGLTGRDFSLAARAAELA